MYRLDEVFADPQVQHLRLVQRGPARGPRNAGDRCAIRSPSSGTPRARSVRRPAPDIGEQHRRDPLRARLLRTRYPRPPPPGRPTRAANDGHRYRQAPCPMLPTASPGSPSTIRRGSTPSRSRCAPRSRMMLAQLNDDPDVRVLVIAGAGGKALRVRRRHSRVRGAPPVAERGLPRSPPRPHPEAWRDVGKPIIAKIQGYCIGGGLLTAMAGRHTHRLRRQPSSALPPPDSASVTPVAGVGR